MMTSEAEWLESTDSHLLWQLAIGRVSERKLRLAAVACCRRGWSLLPSRSRYAIEVGERFAEGKADDAERVSARRIAQFAGEGIEKRKRRRATSAVYYALARESEDLVRAVLLVREAMNWGMDREFADIVRHVWGNLFRSQTSCVWPSTVVQLAESLYAGQDCAFALHDALLEAGHTELAEHFREEKSHLPINLSFELSRGETLSELSRILD
jgi:hypothetical protein